MLPVAKVVKSFGTDGGLLLSSNVDLDTLDFQGPVFIVFDGLQVPFFILDYQPRGNRAVVHLSDVNNLEDAEELVGRTIYADVELEEDDEPDFTGWTILDHGHRLGICTGIEPIPGNPCLYVELQSEAGASGAASGSAAGSRSAAAGVAGEAEAAAAAGATGAAGSGVREVLIPLHEDFIVAIDEQTRTLSLQLPDGLTD